MLVQRHGHAVAGAAHCDSAVHLAAFHGDGERVCHIRIIHALGRMCTEIFHLISHFFEIWNEFALVLETSVIAANTNFHSINIMYYSLPRRSPA